MTESNEKRWRVVDHVVIPVVVAVLSAGVTLLGIDASKEADLQTALLERVSQLETRVDSQRAEYDAEIEDLREQVRSLQNQLLITEAEKAKLSLALNSQLDTEEVFLAAFNGISHPIWMKKVVVLEVPDERGNVLQFIPMLINDAYARTYNVTRYKYIGASDWAVWPSDVAQSFHNNDEIVFKSGRSLRTYETFPKNAADPDGLHVTRRIDKALIELPRGEGYAILGISYELDHVQQAAANQSPQRK